MYKLKYYSLTKEEKQDLKEKFYQTDFGSSMRARLNRLFIIGIMAFMFSIFIFVTNNNIWEIVMGVMLLIASFIFIIGSFKIRVKKLNDYLVKNAKKK